MHIFCFFSNQYAMQPPKRQNDLHESVTKKRKNKIIKLTLFYKHKISYFSITSLFFPHLHNISNITRTTSLVPLECLCNWAITQNVLMRIQFYAYNNESMRQCFSCTYNSFTRGHGGRWAAVLPRAANALATRRYNNGSRYYYSDNKRYESSSSK